MSKNDDKRTFIILEAETCGTISHEHTEKQWKTFFEKSKELDCEFHLVVPKLCGGDSGGNMANQRLAELHIFGENQVRIVPEPEKRFASQQPSEVEVIVLERLGDCVDRD